jgi:hypothetical protein
METATFQAPTSSTIYSISEAERVRLRGELEEVIREIQELRTLLKSKELERASLEKRLGLTPLKKLGASIEHTATGIVESPAVQKTSDTLKTVADKTASALKTVGTSASKAIEDFKHSDTLKNMSAGVQRMTTTMKEGVTKASQKMRQGNTDTTHATYHHEEMPREHFAEHQFADNQFAEQKFVEQPYVQPQMATNTAQVVGQPVATTVTVTAFPTDTMQQ